MRRSTRSPSARRSGCVRAELPARPQWLPQTGDAAGIVLALAVGGAALALGQVLPRSAFLSDILVAIVLGGLILNTPLRRVVGLEVAARDREPDRYANGLRFVGKWVLRLAIILMGLKVRTELFGGAELLLIFGVIAAALPTAFFVGHAVAARVGVRRPMADLVAAGTMICGASAVNAVAPAVGARREEQGVATAAVFLMSVVALLTFRPVAAAVGLDGHDAGLWSGLAVNDLSSAIAVGGQMGPEGGVFAAASKSARVLMLAPALVLFALLRATRRPGSLGREAVATIPRYLFGYILFAGVRVAGDRLFAGSAAWGAVLVADAWAVDLLLLTVAGAIGLHLDVRHLLGASARALAIAVSASVVMSGLTLAMIVAAARGAPSAAALIGVVAVLGAFVAYRIAAGGDRALRLIERRFESGQPLSLEEATRLLAAREDADDAFRRRLLAQLHPTIGELIPARESPHRHGDGSRWLTCWQGENGWALVAICREPCSETPIHAHPHRLLSKTIEGAVEELRFREDGDEVVLESRGVVAHEELVETSGLEGVHAIRVVGPRAAIDLQLRGPEAGVAGRRLRATVDLATLAVDARVPVRQEPDDRPGHGGEGPGAARRVSC